LKALVDHDLMADRKDQKAFLRFFAEFSGWESYMVFYLWRSLSPPQLAAS
jgi:DNA-3-methyladenine glycosylase II